VTFVVEAVGACGCDLEIEERTVCEACLPPVTEPRVVVRHQEITNPGKSHDWKQV
jgi:hypothetical protein